MLEPEFIEWLESNNNHNVLRLWSNSQLNNAAIILKPNLHLVEMEQNGKITYGVIDSTYPSRTESGMHYKTLKSDVKAVIAHVSPAWARTVRSRPVIAEEPPCYCKNLYVHDEHCEWYVSCSRKARGLPV